MFWFIYDYILYFDFLIIFKLEILYIYVFYNFCFVFYKYFEVKNIGE